PGVGVGPRARDAERAVVLLGAADVVRHLMSGGDVVRLRRREGERGPGAPGVGGDGAAPVVGVDHPVGIAGIDPEVVVVAVGGRDVVEGDAAVGGAVHAGVEHVDRVLALRVGVDPRVVEGALAELAVGVGALPGGAAVV